MSYSLFDVACSFFVGGVMAFAWMLVWALMYVDED